MVFRRPELEKDNPTAAQPYMGPRRKRAQTRTKSVAESAGVDEVTEALRTLTKAVSHFVNSLPKAREGDGEVIVLRDAITQAEQVLSVGGRPD